MERRRLCKIIIPTELADRFHWTHKIDGNVKGWDPFLSTQHNFSGYCQVLLAHVVCELWFQNLEIFDRKLGILPVTVQGDPGVIVNTLRLGRWFASWGSSHNRCGQSLRGCGSIFGCRLSLRGCGSCGLYLSFEVLDFFIDLSYLWLYLGQGFIHLLEIALQHLNLVINLQLCVLITCERILKLSSVNLKLLYLPGGVCAIGCGCVSIWARFLVWLNFDRQGAYNKQE